MIAALSRNKAAEYLIPAGICEDLVDKPENHELGLIVKECVNLGCSAIELRIADS